MSGRPLLIRDILLLTIGALTLLIALLVAQEVYGEWQRLQRIQSLKEATLLGDQLFDVAEKLSLERDIAFSMLHAPDEERKSLQSRLESSRQDADTTLKNALQTLKSYNFQGLAEGTGKSEAQYQALQQLRQKIDHVLALPAGKRDETLSRQWFDDATALILQTEKIWMEFISHFIDIDPRVNLHIRFKHFLRIITDYTGRQRSLIGKLIVENADPTPEEQAKLLQAQGVVELSWGISTLLAEQSGLHPAITPFIKDAQSHFFTLYDMVRDPFYVPGAKHGDAYPISAEQWFELATEATESLYTLKDAALKETRHYVETLEYSVQRAIALQIALLLFAFVLCVYSFRVVAARVIGPINAMIAELLKATEGKAVSLTPLISNRQDEIGQLAHVLQAFQQNAETIRQTGAALSESERKLYQAQKMEAIGNLTGGMAHDFNNLLGVVIGNLDLVSEKVKEPEAGKLIEAALDAALRGADLTRRLLAFARQQPLQPQRIEINQLVEGITHLLNRTLGEDITISLNLADNLWPVVADPPQLEAAITNLATNARDAMPHGGKLLIATHNGHLDDDYAGDHPEVAAGDYTTIEVTDTGTGMPPDVIAHIFEPFFTTKERGKGTGLGLAMVFGFMKQSGGHINVYSEVGAGTTFRLYLPRAMGDTAAATQTTAAPLPTGGHETILAVEDNEAMRAVAVRQLKDLGYQVIEAENAAAALQKLATGMKIDLLFTDIVMPGHMNGVELARQVQSRWPEIKVLLTSGFPEAKLNSSQGEDMAGLRLLSKPYRKADLARVLRETLDGKAG